MVASESTLTFERFVEDASERLQKGRSVSGAIVFSERERAIKTILESATQRFNLDRTTWVAKLVGTHQSDFFVLRFHNPKKAIERFFYLKQVKESSTQYATQYAFSYEGYDGFELFRSLIGKDRGLWLGWIGSRFLERFDEFIKSVYPSALTTSVKFVIEQHDALNKNRKGSSIIYEQISKEDLARLRKLHYEGLNEILYITKIRYKIATEKTQFALSLSDKTEFKLEHGDFLDFLDWFTKVLVYAQELRDKFTRRILIDKFKRTTERVEEAADVLSVDRIEAIKIDVEEPIIPDWTDNLVKTFSLDYLPEYGLLNFVQQRGNPYFLAEVVDIQNESRVWISIIQNSIRIVPAIGQTKPNTVSKLISVLQSRVDPSISPIEKW